MVLQGTIDSIEQKGYTLTFGLKDHTKGFMKFSDSDEKKKMKKGDMVHVLIKSVITDSKIVKCELLNS